jgi:hypothetical protein
MGREGSVAIAGMFLACCTSVPPPDTRPLLFIDLENGVARTEQWQSALSDCSDAAFECIEAPGHFLMAFPRACPSGSWDWTVAGFRYRGTAPSPHYAPPSGGLVSYKYPNVHLVYRAGVGFTGLWVTEKPVMSENWGQPNIVEYGIRYVTRRPPFLCERAPG